jgi:cyclomaltodextrinase / maltogenic alpha-amylase / neopullulanase
MRNTPIQLGKYKHFKGTIVEVIGTAFHSELLEEFVLYRHMPGEHGGGAHFWVRPLSMFFEKIEWEGKKVPRFTPLHKN